MPTVTTREIKAALLGFHREGGYKIFDSFPLAADDPTVMFVNATITPFKRCFLDPPQRPEKFALIQRCLRTGGASELEAVGVNPYYFTFFEMFGSGTYGITHIDAVRYLFEIFTVLGIEREKLRFTVPREPGFKEGLLASHVDQQSIFTIADNNVFWQEWKFGRMGPIGKGLTAIYASFDKKNLSVEEMNQHPNQFVEFLNLIFIDRRERHDGTITPIVYPGFDLGVGIERLAAIIQGGNCYQIDSIRPLCDTTSVYTVNLGLNLPPEMIRTLVDHLRAICVLLSENVRPSNKKHGYVLRRLIRRCVEMVWGFAKTAVPLEALLEKFADCLAQNGLELEIAPATITEVFAKEAAEVREAIRRARIILKKQPCVALSVLKDTYGLPPSLLPLAKKEGTI